MSDDTTDEVGISIRDAARSESESTGDVAVTVANIPEVGAVSCGQQSKAVGSEPSGSSLAVPPEGEAPLDVGWRERAARVERRTVLKHWYIRECEKHGVDPENCSPEDRTEDELLVPIVDAAGSGAHPVCTDNACWYRVRLTEPEFRRLHVIECPEDRCWNRLAPDDRLLTAAREIRDSSHGVPQHLVDREYVLELARRDIDMLSATTRDPPVLYSWSDSVEPRLIDGNHRATATALDLIERDEYPGLCVYLGVENPTDVGPLRSFVRTLRSLCE